MNIVLRVFKFLVKRFGSPEMMRKVWDKEFSDNYWDYLEDTRNDPIHEYVARYSRGGAILDLGCGTGTTYFHMLPCEYTRYVGVDISEVAVERCGKKCLETDPGDSKAVFVAAGIDDYVPEEKFSIILFRESIMYIPRIAIRKVLLKYAGYLGPNGVFIVRIHNRIKYSYILDIIKSTFEVLERYEPAGEKTSILVFNGSNAAN